MMRQIAKALVWGALLLSALPALAQSQRIKPIPMDARLAEDGRAVELIWQDAIPMRGRENRLYRRTLGSTGVETWQELTLLSGRHIKTVDDTITPGTPYEYRLVRVHGDAGSVGYWATGTDIPRPKDQSTVFVVQEAGLSDVLAPRFARLRDDLMGAGWQVQWLTAPRHDTEQPVKTLAAARALKAQLRDGVQMAPAGQRHMVLLLGRVPLIKSGRVAPDGHTPEPHVSDLFYGDLSGEWRDDGAGLMIHSRLPKGRIDLPVGRIDFASIAAGDPVLEAAHLGAYLDKAHHWRHGLLGDLRVAYGQSGHLQVEQFDLRNIVGPQAITRGGHHDAGETQPWLWGVDFGHANGTKYPEFQMKPVFAINFGSHKQKIHWKNNAMVGTLAQPFYTVAVAWGGRPSWRLHAMGLGWSIGEMQRMTVNNGAGNRAYPDGMDYVPTGSYPWRAPIWANLLGDPTLSAFPLPTPQNFEARKEGEQVVLTWEGTAARYELLRAPEGEDFAPLGEITSTQRFVDNDPLPAARYQLRALGKQEVYAGSFFAASQGVFAHVDQPRTPAPDLHQSVAGPGPHRLVLDQGDTLLAPIAPPQTGTLTLRATGWHYLPAEGFEGAVDIALSASGSGETVVGRLRLDVRP